MAQPHTRFIQRIFQDNTGKYVIGQPPNVPVYMIIVAFLVRELVAQPTVHQLSTFILYGSLFLWSYLEICYGESPFRRVLGGLVLILVLYLVAK